MGFWFGFDTGFDIMRVFVFAIFAIVIVCFIALAVKGIGTWHKNNNSPRLTVQAAVVAKRQNTDVHHHSNNNGGMHTSTSTHYYVTFQFDSGDRLELHVPGREYGMMAEGDVGDLTFQGTRFLGFDRHTAGAVPEAGPVTTEDVPPRYTEKKSWEPPQETVDTPAEPDIPVVPAPEPEPEPEPAEDALVDVCTYLPGVYADLRYATENNFTGQVIYDFTQPQLRYGTLKKLAQAQEMLAERDLALKIWDAYRPVSAQFRLWEVCPDPQYVADPTKGYSGHSRGNTVDVTLVSADGSPVPMPTDFDDFTAMADRDYSDVSDTAAYDNVRLLEDTMVSCGFRPYSAEWWHFTDTTDYPVVEE